MKKRMNAAVLCIVLLLSILLNLSGCGITAQAEDLMSGIKANSVSTNIDIAGKDATAVMDFAVRLFQQSVEDGSNTLISPLSVLCALAMTANGARGETLSQMEEVFGLSVEELNEYLYICTNSLPDGDKSKLKIANSIWFKDDDSFTVEPNFLQANADYYGAGLYKAPFDSSTLSDINNWVNKNTDGMIQDILGSIPEEAVMYLVNALAFDAEWMKNYDKIQVRDMVFTKEDGTEQETELMYSEENQYLKDTNAVGLLKYYVGKNYAFAALLPDEGISVTEYVASLTGEKLAEILSNSEDVKVSAAIPKFKSEYSVELSEVLRAMGMTDAFNYNTSDFSGIGYSTDGYLYINRVLHKTFIEVDEKGTKARAVTAVGVGTAAGSVIVEEIKIVHLDRPFVYMLIDCEENFPIFIGTVMDVSN
ncbi:MAG: serine protease [Ruminiclostridium sp.]|nr:serine protease [Ruminiclostridium sp.]